MFKKENIIIYFFLLFLLLSAAKNFAQVDTNNQPDRTTQPVQPDTSTTQPVWPDTTMNESIRPDTTLNRPIQPDTINPESPRYPDSLNYLGNAFDFCNHNFNAIINYSVFNTVNILNGKEELFIRKKFMQRNTLLS